MHFVEPRRKEVKDITMDIPHPNSYPVPRGRPGLHDIYAGNETKEKGTQEPTRRFSMQNPRLKNKR
jgi:hypothetical protein